MLRIIRVRRPRRWSTAMVFALALPLGESVAWAATVPNPDPCDEKYTGNSMTALRDYADCRFDRLEGAVPEKTVTVPGPTVTATTTATTTTPSTATSAPPTPTVPPTTPAQGSGESLFEPGAAPAMPATDQDTLRVELGVRFSAAVDGAMKDIRFYKGPGNDGPHRVRLWDAQGTVLAEAVSGQEPAFGWVTVPLPQPVPVTGGRQYTASYEAPAGRYAADANYFTSLSTRGNLTVLPGAGVFTYGDGLPVQSYRATNYWVDVTFVASPGATPTTPPPPPPSPAGWFTSDAQGRILDPDGKEFVPVGVNANGPNWVWGGPTIGKSHMMDVWHFNTLRLNTCFSAGCGPDLPNESTNNDLDGIVREYTAKRNVIMIALGQFGGGAWGGREQALVDWWKTTAAKYKDNPYVWFNLINEPTTGGQADLPAWESITRQLATAVRSVAPHNMIVIDGNAFGQDRATWNCTVGSPSDWDQPNYNGSAIVTYGTTLKRDLGNVLFSVHIYGQWGGNEAGGCREADWDAVMTDYVDKIHSLGLPLVAGEFGAYTDKAREDWTTAGSWNGVHSMFRVLPGKRVGMLAWHGSMGTPFDNLLNPDGDWTDYMQLPERTSLAWQGQALLGYAKQVNPAA